MPIEVRHDMPAEVVSRLASEIGTGQKVERLRDIARQEAIRKAQEDFRREQMEMMYADRDKSRAHEKDIAGMRQQYDMDELQLRDQLYRQRDANRYGLMQERDENQAQLAEQEYTRAQKRELEKINNAIAMVESDPNYTPEEKQELISQLEYKALGIKPPKFKTEPRSPFPAGRDIGQVWQDDNTGAMLTRDDKGNVKVLMEPGNEGAIDVSDQIKVGIEKAKFIQSLLTQQDVSGKSLYTFAQAKQQADAMFADILGPSEPEMPAQQTNDYQQPPSLPTPLLTEQEYQQTVEPILANKSKVIQKAKQEGWPQEEVDALSKILKSGDKFRIGQALKILGMF